MVSEIRAWPTAIGRRLTLDKVRLATLLSHAGQLSRSLTASRGQLAELRKSASAARKVLASFPPPQGPAAGAALEQRLDCIGRRIGKSELSERKILLDIAAVESKAHSVNRGMEQADRRIERLEAISQEIENVKCSQIRMREMGEIADLAAAVRQADSPLDPERAQQSLRQQSGEPPRGDRTGRSQHIESSSAAFGGNGQSRGRRDEKAIDKLHVWQQARTANLALTYSTRSGTAVMVKLTRTADGCLRAKLVAPEAASRSVLSRERTSILRSLGASGVRLESLIVSQE